MQTHQFSSTFGFLMAATGFAVGLGNIWRFPYITGENGGGAFVIVYLGCAILIGIPILIAEIMIGRHGKANPPQAMLNIANGEGRSPGWRHVGHLNLATAFVILGTYCVVAGWVLWYLYKAATTGFSGIDSSTAAITFNGVTSAIGGMGFWTLLSLMFTGTIIFFGVNQGIERSVRVLMPTLFTLMLALVTYNAFQDGFGEAANYLFTPDFSKITGSTFLAAVGQAFFSIGVGMAGMMIFGSYLPPQVSITRCVLIIITIDTLVALIAGLMIFPMVFRFGLDPAGGPGLIFQTLPVAFAQMPGGQFIAIVFFTLLSVAAVTSMVGLLEPLVAWVEDSTTMNRQQATLTMLGAVTVLGFLSILSYNVIADWQVGSRDLNGILDYVSNQIMLPVGGLLIAVFTAWQIHKPTLREELHAMPAWIFETWHLLIRFLLPIAITVILVTGLAW
ncbi:MAG: sodium-dependent transporter [Gammaproteobacteria bacterium]|jgi:neurotransmitter:Na+ symporter, NSS family|nr:sodium-dependent transporter [Gammaproteobacteria bacterium]MBT7371536.1 sodium-dependent transporter [Gammaproteobacteria bacterium]